MMSVPLAMVVGKEQPNVLSTNLNQVRGEKMNFAHSLGEQAGMFTDDKVENFSDKRSSGMQQSDSANSAQNSFDISISPAATKNSVIVNQKLIESGHMKGLDGNVFTAGIPIFPGSASKSGILGKSKGQQQDKSFEPRNLVAGSNAVPDITPTSTVVSASTKVEEELPSEAAVDSVEAVPIMNESLVTPQSKASSVVMADKSSAHSGPSSYRSVTEPSSRPVKRVVIDKSKEVEVPKKAGKFDQQVVALKPQSEIANVDLIEKSGPWTEAPNSSTLAIQNPSSNATQNVVVKKSTGNAYQIAEIGEGQATAATMMSGVSERNKKAVGQSEADETILGGHSTQTDLEKQIGKEASDFPTIKSNGDVQKQLVAVTAAPSAHLAIDSHVGGAGSLPISNLESVPSMKGHTGEAVTHLRDTQIVQEDHDAMGSTSTEIGVAHQILAKTPTTLEVGLQSGSQGWLKIRAEMTSSGTVNASVSSASLTGQEMLHRELPALAAYLQDEKVALNSLVVHPAPPGVSNSPFSGETDVDGRGQAKQSGHQEDRGEKQGETGPTSGSMKGAIKYANLTGVEGSGSLLIEMYEGGGSWLNVRV